MVKQISNLPLGSRLDMTLQWKYFNGTSWDVIEIDEITKKELLQITMKYDKICIKCFQYFCILKRTIKLSEQTRGCHMIRLYFRYRYSMIHSRIQFLMCFLAWITDCGSPGLAALKSKWCAAFGISNAWTVGDTLFNTPPLDQGSSMPLLERK